MAGSERKRGDFIAGLIEAEAQRREQQKTDENSQPMKPVIDYNHLDWPTRLETKLDNLTEKIEQLQQREVA